MHEQLELMTMSWTNTDHREDLYRSGRDPPFARARSKAIATIWRHLTSLASRPLSTTLCPLAHVTCQYCIHDRPPVFTSHVASARLGKVSRGSESVSPF